jgi:hypothetical protein
MCGLCPRIRLKRPVDTAGQPRCGPEHVRGSLRTAAGSAVALGGLVGAAARRRLHLLRRPDADLARRPRARVDRRVARAAQKRDEVTRGRPRAAAAAAVTALAAAALGSTACGGTNENVSAARPQTVEIGAMEFARHHGVGFKLELRRLVVTRDGWRVDARITNATPVTWTVGRPHVRHETKFGLFVAQNAADLRPRALEASGRLTPPLIADRFRPRLPRIVPPGASWAGSFSGPGPVPRGSFVAVAFGRFTTTATPPGGLPRGLLVVSPTPVKVD